MSKNLRINDRIRAREVRVIDEEGVQLGVMHPLTALEIARQKGLDLVEVAPTAVPPVCKLLDYGRFRYEQTKRDRESRKAQKVITIKEVRLYPKMAEHDIQTSLKRVKRFLEDGDKVRLRVVFRGREITHPEIGRDIIDRIISDVGSPTVEQAAQLEGKHMVTVLAPRKQTVRAARPAGEDGDTATRREVEAHA